MTRRIEPAGEKVERTQVTAASGLSRRTVVTGAALSVPAVTLMSVSPAFAASGNTVSLSAPSMQVPASGGSPVTAAVKNASGNPVAGAAVSFSGPSGASFSPVSATTNSSGTAVTQMNLGTPWAKPGSSVSVTAVSGGQSRSDSFTVVGSNLLVSGLGYSSTSAQSELAFPSPVVDASGGGSDVDTWFMVLLANGTVWTKGKNASGQLGDGSTTDRSTWTQVPGLSGVTQIAGGRRGGCALLSNGSVKAWGRNVEGQVGDGSGVDRPTPTQVSGLSSGVTQIAAASSAMYALLSDGSVRAWGFNNNSQMGDGSTTNRLQPVQVSGLTSGVAQISAGSSTGYALLSNGSVKAWGWNAFGQIGDGSTTNRLVPVQVLGLPSRVTRIVGGTSNGYALLPDGSVKAWGSNDEGHVGDGTTSNRYLPVQVQGLTSGVTQINSGQLWASALLQGGTVRAWGKNDRGQLGDGTTTTRLSPVSVTVPAGRDVQRLGTNASSSWTSVVVLKTT